MKSLLVLSFLVTLAYGQDAECGCGAFVTVDAGEAEVVSFPDLFVDDCSEEAACAELCLAEWEELANGGDLCTETSDGATAAQLICDNLAELGIQNVPPAPVYLYYNLCDGAWQYDGEGSTQNIECWEGESLVPCPERT